MAQFANFLIYIYAATVFLIYLFLKIILGIIMIVIIQKGYNGDWSTNKCDNIKSLTLYWLIWHYISIISLIIYMIYCFFRVLLSSDKEF